MLQESEPSKCRKLRRFRRRPGPWGEVESPAAAKSLLADLLHQLLQRLLERVDIVGLDRGHDVVGAGAEVVAVAVGLLLLAAVAVLAVLAIHAVGAVHAVVVLVRLLRRLVVPTRVAVLLAEEPGELLLGCLLCACHQTIPFFARR